ncbi:hypothetical protein NE237_011914 [Protea cynaroides]|uniref:Uncharacterized protein n=1 Tax=Protea cynaroides TaxID=273540 RepID=A0A9Q0GVU7_9MAGN|nr:hypothetical protein NE237_011914 [Protea cynaroides]
MVPNKLAVTGNNGFIVTREHIRGEKLTNLEIIIVDLEDNQVENLNGIGEQPPVLSIQPQSQTQALTQPQTQALLTNLQSDELEELDDLVQLVEEDNRVGDTELSRTSDLLLGQGHTTIDARNDKDGTVHLRSTGDHILAAKVLPCILFNASFAILVYSSGDDNESRKWRFLEEEKLDVTRHHLSSWFHLRPAWPPPVIMESEINKIWPLGSWICNWWTSSWVCQWGFYGSENGRVTGGLSGVSWCFLSLALHSAFLQ